MSIAWPSKDPEAIDTRSHDFSDLLDSGETVTGYTSTRLAGTTTATERAVGPTDTSATFDVSGGVDGETAVFDILITTSAGRVLPETIVLPVVSTVGSALVITGYVAPTVANLKAKFPVFAATDVASVQDALDEAVGQVDDSWTEADFPVARMLYAAHVLTMNGHGAGPAAQVAGLTGVSELKSGALTLKLSDKKEGGTVLSSTTYGQRFEALRRQNKGGFRVTSGITGFMPCTTYGW